jgi:hypothetical protein
VTVMAAAVAGAWRVLGDPARRAPYDQALTREQAPPAASGPPAPAVVTPPGQVPGPLWAGPARAQGPHQVPAPGRPDDEDIRLAVRARLALRCLIRDADWPW